MLLHQIREVGRTYLTQRYLRWGALLISVMVVPQFLVIGSSSRSATDAAQPMLMVLGMPLFFVIPFLVAQVKTQFAHSRARLLPGFYAPHLAVLCGILLTSLLIYPSMVARGTGLELLGPITLACAMAAPAVWGVHFNRFLPILVAITAFYSLYTDWGLHWWIVDAAEHRMAHVLIVLTGVALIVAWLWRLCHLDEEMDDYQGFHQMLMARRTGTEVIEQRRIVAMQMRRSRLTSWIGDGWHDRLGGYFGGSQAGLVRLLRYGFAANPVEVQGLFMGAMFILIAVFIGQFSYLPKGPSGFGASWFLIIFVTLLPGQMAGETMAQRRPRVAAEMLLPVRRSELIDGLFASATRNSVILWLMMNGALAAIAAILRVDVSFRLVAMYLLFSASTLFASIGLGLRVSVWPSMFKRFTAVWISWVFCMAPMIAWWTQRDKVSDAPFLLVPIIMLAIGALLYRSARRTWLNLELG